MHRMTCGLIMATALGWGVAQAEPADYTIDADHTYVTFAIDHHGASVNRGRFDEVTGSVRFDPDIGAGQIDLSVQVRSVHSGSRGFDVHLLSADLFDAAQYPTMRFVSDELIFEGQQLVAIPGQLTLLGRTQPLTLRARQFTCYDNQRAKTQACGGDFEAVLDRTQWGMDYLVNAGMPRNVRITATIEAFRQ